MAGSIWDEQENLWGDPAGYLTGTNKEGFGGVKKMLFGDPDAIKKAYDQMAGIATTMTGQTRDFLAKQQGKALQYYQPLQHMFNAAYGTEGLQPAQIPQAPSAGPLSTMYGGK